MDLLTSRFLKTVGVFTGLHTLVWLGCRFVLTNGLGEDPTTDILLALLLISGIPVAMMFCAQWARQITGASWQESMFALLIAGPLSFCLAWEAFVFLGIENTVYLAAINLMGLFLLPLWDGPTRAEYGGALAIPEKPILSTAILAPLAVAALAYFFHPGDRDAISIIAWLTVTCFFFGSIISVVLSCLGRWKDSAMLGASVTLTFITGLSVIVLLALLFY